MNYRHIYMSIIAHAKSEEKLGIRIKNNGTYYEAHHILPKSLFQNWAKRKSNMVLLTAREHFFCHQLLTKIWPSSQMNYALIAFIIRPNADYKITSREYERIKVLNSNLMKEKMTGKHNSEEHKRKIAEANKGLKKPDWVKENCRKAQYKINAKKLKMTLEEYMQYRQSAQSKNKNHIKLTKGPSGYHWWTNGEINVHSKECPGPNFKIGRIVSWNR